LAWSLDTLVHYYSAVFAAELKGSYVAYDLHCCQVQATLLDQLNPKIGSWKKAHRNNQQKNNNKCMGPVPLFQCRLCLPKNCVSHMQICGVDGVYSKDGSKGRWGFAFTRPRPLPQVKILHLKTLPLILYTVRYCIHTVYFSPMRDKNKPREGAKINVPYSWAY
jgi:hypothetical protein